MGIEEAAVELREHVLSSVGQACMRKEEKLRTAATVVGHRRGEIRQQLADMVHALEVDRDLIIEAASRRCQENVELLEGAARKKEAALKEQHEALLAQAERLTHGRESAEQVMQGIKASEQPLELVQTCLKLVENMGPVVETEMPTQPVDTTNLHVVLPPLENLVNTIMSRGWAGSQEVDASKCSLGGLGSVSFPLESSCTLTLHTRDQRGERIDVSEGLISVKGRIITADGSDAPEIPIVVQNNGVGLYTLAMTITENMLDHDLEVDAEVGGWAVKDSPCRVTVINNPLQSSIITVQHHRQALKAFLSFFPQKSFRCLYRASRDGWATRAFHLRCDNQGPTVVLLKSTTNGSIFGG